MKNEPLRVEKKAGSVSDNKHIILCYPFLVRGRKKLHTLHLARYLSYLAICYYLQEPLIMNGSWARKSNADEINFIETPLVCPFLFLCLFKSYLLTMTIPKFCRPSPLGG